MRIVVTGGAGFIGSNLCRVLAAEGSEAVVIDDGSGEVDYLPEGVERHRVRCADLAGKLELLRGADAIVHLSARPSVEYANQFPLEALDANVGDTLRVLLAAVEAGVPRFVFASSNAAVGNIVGPVAEDALPRPVGLYGASKLAGEAHCQAVAASYGVDCVSLRFSNCYGPFSDHKQSAVHLFIRKALAGESIKIYGDGAQTRDFIYVEDIARAIAAASAQPCGPVLQIGTGIETPLSEMVAAIEEAVGSRFEIEREQARTGDVRSSVSDNRLAEQQLGWKPRVSLREGVAHTVDYYRAKRAEAG